MPSLNCKGENFNGRWVFINLGDFIDLTISIEFLYKRSSVLTFESHPILLRESEYKENLK